MDTRDENLPAGYVRPFGVLQADARAEADRAEAERRLQNKIIDERAEAERTAPRSSAHLMLIYKMLKNSERLDRDEANFKDAIGRLSNFRRAAAFQYVETLRERINILEQLRNLAPGEG
jgi:hypothetical protein